LFSPGISIALYDVLETSPCSGYLLTRPDLSDKRGLSCFFTSLFSRSSVMGNILLWTKPATPVLVVGLLSDLTRSRTDLLIENALLRQQLIILKRQVKRPQLTDPERFRLVFLSHFTKFWK